jgi:hypothetical protein
MFNMLMSRIYFQLFTINHAIYQGLKCSPFKTHNIMLKSKSCKSVDNGISVVYCAWRNLMAVT